ncbi:SAM-dependent methyltransferase, partial [Pseudophaeobacter sp.]
MTHTANSPAHSRSGMCCLGRGQVAFAGSGPGDPELLTLKVARALQEAD